MVRIMTISMNIQTVEFYDAKIRGIFFAGFMNAKYFLMHFTKMK